MTGRGTRTAAALCAAVLAFALSPGPASAEDDPSAYTDPAPAPVQDEQAAEDVQRTLRAQGVSTAVTPPEVHTGVVVQPRPRPKPPTPERPSAPPPLGEGPTVSPAGSLVLTTRGLAPSARSGVARPTDPEIPDSAPLALGAIMAAAAAGIFALRRR